MGATIYNSAVGIRGAFSKSTFDLAKFKDTALGDIQRISTECLVTSSGVWAVHRRGQDDWAVSHVPSGKAVSWKVGTRDNARALALSLNSIETADLDAVEWGVWFDRQSNPEAIRDLDRVAEVFKLVMAGLPNRR